MLFAEYLKSPANTRVAVEIKMLDDAIAEWAARTERGDAGRNAPKRRFETSTKNQNTALKV
jgi:hypothetical protein